MFNPVLVGLILTSVLLAIAAWAMVTQESENMEGEDFSYFASKEQKQAREESRKFRQAA